MNSPSYTVLDLAPFVHGSDVIHQQARDEVIDRLRQALAGYDTLVRGDGRFCPPPFPKADGSALHYIERVAQGVIPGPCLQARTTPGDEPHVH